MKKLYPEWNVASLRHVPGDISRAVQASLLALADHAEPAILLEDCIASSYSTENCQWGAVPRKRCDTTQRIAEIAKNASDNGKYSSWQTTLSYMSLRSMQELTGFISRDPEDNVWKCTRSTTLYDSITCPEGYSKESEEIVMHRCTLQGHVCNENYQCVCHPCRLIKECVDSVDINGTCVAYHVLLPAILLPLFVILGVCVHCYVEYKRRQADAVWSISRGELKFGEPVEILGQGSFGCVTLAEYRGTKVAVKRILPSKEKRRRGDNKGVFTNTMGENGTKVENGGDAFRSADLETGSIDEPGLTTLGLNDVLLSLTDSLKLDKSGLSSVPHRLSSITMSTSDSHRRKLTFARLKTDFVQEMRYLAKLRHPCITTIMGAVIAKGSEPMLVMEYMNLGSLYEVLRRPDLELDVDEHLLPILQDIAQGIRFLHAASPQIIHGDLKTKNVLIQGNPDSLRAKDLCYLSPPIELDRLNPFDNSCIVLNPLNPVETLEVTDFGLIAKKRHSANSTPYWMAPELLLGKSTNTAYSDMYAMGILMYEVFSGQNPYEGECHKEVLKEVCDPRINKRPPVPKNCLMPSCLARDPKDRPSAELVDVALRVEGSVKERTSKLVKLNRELEEANRTIATASQMQLEHFACMSHEIRTPLNCIVGLSSLMEGSGLNHQQKESISMIASSSKLLKAIVDDVLDYSKLQSGNAETLVAKTDLESVISDLVHSMKASDFATRRNLSIRTRFDPSVTQYVQTDGRRLLQILYNLVSNAVKFSKENGIVEVGINLCDQPESVELPPEDEQGERRPLFSFAKSVLRFTVKDYGKGIKASDFHSIFQPFTQTNSGIRNTEGGTGLGLAITEKLVKALGGTISVDSCVNVWTEFTVDIPFDEPSAAANRGSIRSSFKDANIFVVGHDQHVGDIFDYFHIPTTVVSSMKEIEATLPMEQESSNKQVTLIGVVESQLFKSDISRRLLQSRGMKIVVHGQMDLLEDGILYYPSLGEKIASVFLEELRNFARKLPEKSEAKASPATPPSEATGSPSDLTRLRVLCAEDNLINQKNLIRMLKRLGIDDSQIEVVENGQLAVEKEASKEFDVVLMDMQMPVMDGIEATKLITKRHQTLQEGEHFPLIVFVTAHVSASFEAQCIQCGAASYLPKPYVLPVLKETLLDVASKLGNVKSGGEDKSRPLSAGGLSIDNQQYESFQRAGSKIESTDWTHGC